MGRRSGRLGRLAPAELVSVAIVDEPQAAAGATMEIAYPGGPVIRVREDVPSEVLERVVRVCQRVQAEGAAAPGPVRSC